MKTENENMTPTAESATPGNPGALSFTVPAVTLRAALKACAPAMSKDPARLILTALYFELRRAEGPLKSHDVLSVVGCDGRRLHIAQIPVFGAKPFPGPRSLNFILPAPAVRALLKTCLPAKVKTGEALLTVTKPAGQTADVAGAQWLTVNTSAGEVSNIEQSGNYPNFRQVMPRATILDDSLTLSAGDLRNVGELEDSMGATFAAHCLRAAWQSSRDRRLPYTEAQIKAMISPTVKRMLKKARERNNSFYFERFPAGRLVPLALSVGPVPAFQITEAGLVLTNGEQDVSLGYGGNPVSIMNAPGPTKVAFNPVYLIDLHDALSAFDSAPGSPCGPLRAHDALASFSIKSDKAMDSGDGFGFYAVVMPQKFER